MFRNASRGTSGTSTGRGLTTDNWPINKLAKLGDAIDISKSETINHSPTDWQTNKNFKATLRCDRSFRNGNAGQPLYPRAEVYKSWSSWAETEIFFCHIFTRFVLSKNFYGDMNFFRRGSIVRNVHEVIPGTCTGEDASSPSHPADNSSTNQQNKSWKRRFLSAEVIFRRRNRKVGK